MQRNGLEIQFTHRSFQEYFAAYCLSQYLEDKMPEIVWRMLGRPEDNVIPMLFEMKRDRIENDFIIPRLREICTLVADNNATEDCLKHQELFEYTVHLHRFQKIYRISVNGGNSYYQFITLLRKLYRAEFRAAHDKTDDYRLDDDRAGARIAKLRRKRKEKFSVGSDIELTSEEILETGFRRYCQNDLTAVQKILNKAVKRKNRTSKSISEILDL
jgi:hypothetical protein